MEAHGVTKRNHRKLLVEILGLSNSHAHKKLAGNVGWSLDQLKTVLDHFQESPSAIFDDLLGNNGIAATIKTNNKESPCFIWLGHSLDEHHPYPFVAVNRKEKWVVIDSEAEEIEQKFFITRIEFQQPKPPKARIAVIDDDKASADVLCTFLNESGFSATSFYEPESLLVAHQENPFDGYIVDWILEKQTAESLIKTIRKSNVHVPIILMTGQLSTGKASESEIANAIINFGVLTQEKPVRLHIVIAEISKALGLL
ncbi:MAG: response regulator [Ottowia sp.]|nr:response regulator [Ottowia sp.]